MGIALPRYTTIYKNWVFDMVLEEMDPRDYWEMYERIDNIANGVGRKLTLEEIESIMRQRLKIITNNFTFQE